MKCQKNVEKKLRNVECKNVEINVEKNVIFYVLHFLYSKKTSNLEMSKEKNIENDVSDVLTTCNGQQ